MTVYYNQCEIKDQNKRTTGLARISMPSIYAADYGFSDQ